MKSIAIKALSFFIIFGCYSLANADDINVSEAKCFKKITCKKLETHVYGGAPTDFTVRRYPECTVDNFKNNTISLLAKKGATNVILSKISEKQYFGYEISLTELELTAVIVETFENSELCADDESIELFLK